MLLIDQIQSGRMDIAVTHGFDAFYGDTAHDVVAGYLRQLTQVTVFEISNVYDYWWQQRDVVYPWNFVEEIPNAAPPFTRFWMEFRAFNERVGVLFNALEPVDANDSLIQGAKWLLTANVLAVAERRKALVCPAGEFSFVLDPDGRIIDGGLGVPKEGPGRRFSDWWGTDMEKLANLIDEEASTTLGFINVALFAIAFLHCRNVRVEANEPFYASRQERRAAQQRGEQPRSIYHTLMIEPMKQVLATEGVLAQNGLKKALHICRGHFAEYGDAYGKGKLFGKYEGRFWMPAHVRGSADVGTVQKDYAIKAPKRGAA